MVFKDNDLVEISTFFLSFLKNLTATSLKLLICYLRKINPLEIINDKAISRNSYPDAAYIEISAEEFCHQHNITYGPDYIRFLRKSLNELSDIKVTGTDESKAINYVNIHPFPFLYMKNVKGKEIMVFKPLEEAIPLFFNLQNYIKSSGENFVHLSSTNQIFMVFWLEEQLFHKRNTCEVELDELKSTLGISPDKYPLYRNFRSAVLEVCMKEINNHTNIYFTFEKGRLGPCGKVESLIFHIRRKTPSISNNTHALLSAGVENSTLEIEDRINKLTEFCKKKMQRQLNCVENDYISTWIKEFGVSESLVKAALEDNAFRGAYLSLKNVNDTLKKWHEHGIKTVEDADIFCNKEHAANKRRAAQKYVPKTSWRTGEEAGIVYTLAPSLSKKTEDTVKSDENVSDGDDDIPEDILDMFGDDGEIDS